MEKDFVSAVLTLDGEVNRDSAVRSFYLVGEEKKRKDERSRPPEGWGERRRERTFLYSDVGK